MSDEIFLGNVCCTGRATIKVWKRDPLIIRWADSNGGNEGQFDTSNYPAEQHPFTWAMTSQPSGGFYRYNVELRTASGDPDGSTIDPPLSEPVLMFNPGYCLPINRFRIQYSNGFSYQFDEFANSWDRPANMGSQGNGSIEFYDSSNNYVGTRSFRGNEARQLYKIRLNTYQHNENNPGGSLCEVEAFCVLEIKNALGNIVQSVQFSPGVGCPNVWTTGCDLLEPPETTHWNIKSSSTFVVTLLGESIRTQITECLAVYGVVNEEGANGIVVYINRAISIEMRFMDGLRPRVINTNRLDQDLIGYKWSPIGCPGPMFTLECDSVPEDPKCPDGTAYECTREDGKKCCYDCEGNVIAVIDPG